MRKKFGILLVLLLEMRKYLLNHIKFDFELYLKPGKIE